MRFWRTLWITNNSRISIQSSTQRTLHWLLNKRWRKLNNTQLSRRVPQNRILQIQRTTLIHTRIGLLHTLNPQHLTLDSHTSYRVRYLSAIVEPRVLYDRTNIACCLTIPFQIRANIENLILDRHRKQRFDFNLKQNCPVV